MDPDAVLRRGCQARDPGRDQGVDRDVQAEVHPAVQ
jgi:hypothetical protein